MSNDALVDLIWHTSPVPMTYEQARAMAQAMRGHDGAYSHGLMILDDRLLRSLLLSEAYLDGREMTESEARRKAAEAMGWVGHGFPRVSSAP